MEQIAVLAQNPRENVSLVGVELEATSNWPPLANAHVMCSVWS